MQTQGNPLSPKLLLGDVDCTLGNIQFKNILYLVPKHHTQWVYILDSFSGGNEDSCWIREDGNPSSP